MCVKSNMHTINARNVHQALPIAVNYIEKNGIEQDSHKGPVVVAPHPTATVCESSAEMCCFWPNRHIDPFAVLFEGLLMLEGCNFGQLKAIGNSLKENRRQVLTMYNKTITFQMNSDNELDMYVVAQSNELVRGMYAPRFGILHQYIAAQALAPLGRYRQLSMSWYVHKETLHLQSHTPVNPYETGEASAYNIMGGVSTEEWNIDLKMFVDQKENIIGYKTPFFRKVAVPLSLAHKVLKTKENPDRISDALQHVEACRASDWRLMCRNWILDNKNV